MKGHFSCFLGGWSAEFSLDEEGLIELLDYGVSNYLYLSAFRALKVKASTMKGGSLNTEFSLDEEDLIDYLITESRTTCIYRPFGR